MNTDLNHPHGRHLIDRHSVDPSVDHGSRGLREALETTCRTWAKYDQVVRDFGPVQPFPTLRDAEAHHITALEALFVRTGLRLPNTRCRESVPHFKNMTQAVKRLRQTRPTSRCTDA
jgi:hypothetical protein